MEKAAKCLLIFVFLILNSAGISASFGCDALPWMMDKSIPVCPAGGSQLLPETFPALGFVISTQSKSQRGRELTSEFILKALRAAGDRVPLLFVPGSDKEFSEFMQSEIDDATRRPMFSSYRELWKNAVFFPMLRRFQWQQDYFKSTFDPQTGFPVLRPIRDYKNHDFKGEYATFRLSQLISKTCPSVSRGEHLPPRSAWRYRFGTSAMGGNSLGLPGGLTLTGDTQDWETTSRHYVQDKSDLVRVSTSWLHVGHVDEIVGILKDRYQAAPCNFVLAIASPKKALELMQEKKARHLPFFSFPAYGRSRAQDAPVAEILQGMKELRESLGSSNQVSATAIPTNGEVIAASHIKSRAWADYNELIQIELDQAEKEILDQMRRRTGCPAIKTVHLPTIFYGGKPVAKPSTSLIEVEGKVKKLIDLTSAERKSLPVASLYQLPSRSAMSVFPNPINAVPIEDTVIIPEPYNFAFHEAISTAYEELGLKTETLDTWQAHIGGGNLHCSTNALRFCRPLAIDKKSIDR